LKKIALLDLLAFSDDGDRDSLLRLHCALELKSWRLSVI